MKKQEFIQLIENKKDAVLAINNRACRLTFSEHKNPIITFDLLNSDDSYILLDQYRDITEENIPVYTDFAEVLLYSELPLHHLKFKSFCDGK